MSVTAFLAELRNRDIQIRADGEQLRCNAPAGVLTPELREQLRQRKGEILDFLRSAEAHARQERAIIPLQPHGERIPIFAVGGHNGDVFCYRALTLHLGDNQPFFGLQPPGLDGHSEPLLRVEDLAAYFAAQIHTFRPGGPYVIAGYCAGGTVAFELARQLLESGAVISFVALFGSPYPTWFRLLPQLAQRLAHRIERLGAHARTLAPLSSRERRAYIAEKLRQYKTQRDAEHAAALDPVLVLRTRVQDATEFAVRHYFPRHYPGLVSLFFPCKDWRRHVGDAAQRWRLVAQCTEEYFGPDGCDATNMLLEPHVEVIAELFRRCCENSKTEVARSRADRRRNFSSVTQAVASRSTSGGHPAN